MSTVQRLYTMFKESGLCLEPLAEDLAKDLVAPQEVKEMLLLSREWHLKEDHCGVFGVNMFDAATIWLDKLAIIGDQELVQQWEEEHPVPNCAQKDWECFAAVSEFDFLFVCVIPGEDFGATRRMVNNCWEDTGLTMAPFTCFLEGLTKYVEEHNRLKGDQDGMDDLNFFSFFNS